MDIKMSLTRNELLDIYRSLDNPKRDRDSVIDAMAAAVDAAMNKLAEQYPVAWYVPDNEFIHGHITLDKHMAILYKHRGVDIKPLYAHPCVSPASDKAACVPEKAESDTQTNYQGFLDSSSTPNEVEEALRKELDLVGLDISAYSSPKEALEALIDWHVGVAIDPRANGGWQLVPKEPTPEMLDAGVRAFLTGTGAYKAMLAAAPKYTGESKCHV